MPDRPAACLSDAQIATRLDIIERLMLVTPDEKQLASLARLFRILLEERVRRDLEK